MSDKNYLITTVWLNVEPTSFRGENPTGLHVASMRKTRPRDGGLWIQVKIKVDRKVFASRLEAVLTVDLEEEIQVAQTFAVPGTGEVDVEHVSDPEQVLVTDMEDFFKGDDMDGASDY